MHARALLFKPSRSKPLRRPSLCSPAPRKVVAAATHALPRCAPRPAWDTWLPSNKTRQTPSLSIVTVPQYSAPYRCATAPHTAWAPGRPVGSRAAHRPCRS
eukprot:356552-Chlamydomonas_euryale.AAC.7